MRKGGGKSKGSSFERLICCQLSLWLSNGVQEDLLWRSAASGGRSTVALRKGKNFADQAGDICAIAPLGHSLTDKYFLELKFYKDLNFIGLLTGKGNLVKFWKIAKEQAANYKKLPILIAKQNAQPVFILLSKEGADAFNIKLKCLLCCPQLNLYLFLLDDFLNRATRPSSNVVNSN